MIGKFQSVPERTWSGRTYARSVIDDAMINYSNWAKEQKEREEAVAIVREAASGFKKVLKPKWEICPDQKLSDLHKDGSLLSQALHNH